MQNELVSTAGEFEPILQQFVESIFPGAKIKGRYMAKKPRKGVLGAGLKQTIIRARQNDESLEYIEIERSQPFKKNEAELLELFCEESGALINNRDQKYFKDLYNAIIKIVVSKSLAGTKFEVIFSVISELESLAAQTYEGNRISIAIGIDFELNGEGPTCAEYFNEDLSRIISNGHDTIVVLGANHKYAHHCELDDAPIDESVYAPYRSIKLAQWATNGKVCVVLNRNGEILTFRNGELVFAKRRGEWRYFNHSNLIDRMCNRHTTSWRRDLRVKLYLCVIDMAFNRKGACFGIAKRSSKPNMIENAISPTDVQFAGDGIKCKVLGGMLMNKNLKDLGRRTISEIASIDGAVVCDYQGEILAAGAILRISSEDPQSDEYQTGGARTKAAKLCSKYGIGIKVSNDGNVQFYDSGTRFLSMA